MDPNMLWSIKKLFNSTSIEKTAESLLNFCTKISMSEKLI